MRRAALLLPVLLAACGPAEETAPPPPSQTKAKAAPAFPFTDVTGSSGVDVVHRNGASGQRYFPETMAPGVALFDADGDSDLDLYSVNGGPLDGEAGPEAENRLFLNRGDGTFDEVPGAGGANDRGHAMGAAVGDADGDGDDDLYVVNYGKNVLYLNDGAARFTAVTAGVEDPSWSIDAAFFDYDGDKDLDLFVVNYLDYEAPNEAPCKAGPLVIYCSPEPFAPVSDRLFRNDGLGPDGVPRFTDVTAESGIAADGRGMGMAVGDLDGDGDLDVYVANDKSQNQLYLDEGERFAEVAAISGAGYGDMGQIEGGMAAVIGDLTGSGRAAIFHTNFQKEPNRLFVAASGAGDGFLFFDDRTAPSGVGFPSHERVSWGMAALDVEGDSDLDLVVANGHVFDNAEEFIQGSAYRMPDQLFSNDGDGSFRVVDFPGSPLASRGVAAGDLDGDGDSDLVITSCGDRLRVWRNDAGRPERFLVVELAGDAPNPRALGARVTAWIGGRAVYREAVDAGGYASHGDVRPVFGLGDAGRLERLEVRWPDGSVEEAGPQDGGRRVVWRKGEGIVLESPLGGGTP